MNLQNGYKVIYEKIADSKRTFYVDKLDGTAAEQIGNAIEIGTYKLVYEKDGQIYGSTSGVPTTNDHCFTEFDKVFCCAHVDENEDNQCDKCEEEMPTESAGEDPNATEGKGNSQPEE